MGALASKVPKSVKDAAADALGKQPPISEPSRYLCPSCVKCAACCQIGCCQVWWPAWSNSIKACEGVFDGAETGSKDWPSPVYACHEDLYVCCCSLLCPCVVSSRNRAYVSPAGQSCEAICCNTPLMFFCCPCYLAQYRTMMRTKFDVKGSTQEDCLTTCFCCPCAMCQEARFIRLQQGDGDYATKPPPDNKMN